MFGFELAYQGEGYTFDSELDVVVMGISADFKIQPSLGIVEPYVMAGVGGFHFQDGILNETAIGPGLRYGAGIDFRGNHLALGLRYGVTHYGFANAASFSDGLGAQTESLGLNLSFYL